MAQKQFEVEVEGLRGLAALMVLYTHLFAPNHDVDPGYTPSVHFYDFEAGQGAVLLFFVLSGYVIGLTNKQPFSVAAGGRYLRRRFIRLVPLYWLAIALSVLVLPTDGTGTIVGNVFFLQSELPYGDVHIPLLAANTNLWSLNYEALYYLLFLVLWSLPVGILWPFVVSCVVLIVGLIRPDFPPIITNYAAGWMFWLSGLWLASTPRVVEENKRHPWPSLMLFALASWKIKPLFFLTRRLGLSSAIEGWVNITFVDFIPVCVALVMIASWRRPRFSGLLIAAAAAVPILFMLWRILRGRFLLDELAVYDGVVIAAIALWWWRPSLRLLRWAAPLGGISYGIYIFQRPAQWAIAYSDGLPDGSVFTFALRTLVICGLTLGLAWVTEKKLQPLIRRALSGPAP